jgi:tRNA threonylcarbamoyl adenosine modification protein YeaZ
MTILTLETSTPHASLAVWRDGNVVRAWSFQSERSHNSRLFAPLAEALDLAEPDFIVVGTGPGSYAGVRVALSAALALALAKNVPLLGWPSLTAFDLPGGTGLVIGDARRGGFFVADIVNGRLAGPPAIVDADALAVRTQGTAVWTFDERPPVPHAVQATPSAVWLARRVAALSHAERTALAAITPEPLYLRAPFITSPRARGRGGALRSEI